MYLLQSIRIALDMLRMHKLRAFLTMVGVIIGVMSVTLITMVSAGFQHYLDTEFKKLGSDTIILVFDPGKMNRGSLGSVEGLTLDDVEYLRERVTSLDIVSASSQTGARKVRVGENTLDNPTIYLVDENFSELNRMGVVAGRHLTKADMDSRSNICVIGIEMVDRLFPEAGSKDDDPAVRGKKALGKLITMDGITMEVVGVLENIEIMGSNTAKTMLVPITTAQDKWVGGDQLGFVTMRPKAGYKVEDTMQAVWEAMMARSGNKPIYRLESRESMLAIFGSIIGVTGVVLAGIAALSLLVGGIGIMNIMLVSVTERTKEIGLRKAVGARSQAIMSQFLVEAATLSLVGGLIGMGLAWGLGNVVWLFTVMKEWPNKSGLATPFPIMAALMSAAFSAFIGVVFGLYPAVSASKLDPIVALRKE